MSSNVIIDTAYFIFSISVKSFDFCNFFSFPCVISIGGNSRNAMSWFLGKMLNISSDCSSLLLFENTLTWWQQWPFFLLSTIGVRSNPECLPFYLFCDKGVFFNSWYGKLGILFDLERFLKHLLIVRRCITLESKSLLAHLGNHILNREVSFE